jgi:phosphatidate phosphatase PAH1
MSKTTDILAKMDFLNKLKDYCNDINGTNFNGAIDVIVVKHKDHIYTSSPFHVRFGKLGVLKSKEKIVNIELNGEPVKDLLMKLCEYGEAWFFNEVEKVEKEQPMPLPLPVPVPVPLSVNEDAESEMVSSTSSMSSTCSLKSDININAKAKANLKHSNSESNVYVHDSLENTNIEKYLKAALALNLALNPNRQFDIDSKCPCEQEPHLVNFNSEANFKLKNDTKSTREVVVISSECQRQSPNQSQNKTAESVLTNNSNRQINVEELALKSLFYEKSHYLSSEQLKRLNLKEGVNTIKYSVTSPLQGTTTIQSNIFLWNHDDKIIVSDIDGTITKSDVLGHILPIVGRDWFHEGIVDLFTSLEKKGYKILYLSARSICQYELTQSLLKNIKQSNSGLPNGPVLLNPINILNAFQVEVIEKKPDQFKIACLDNIKALFASSLDHSPFYAGNFIILIFYL